MGEQDEILDTKGIFVGDEFVKKGEKNGREWVKHRLKFKPFMDSDKQFSFSAFLPLPFKQSIQKEDLEQGKEYTIKYKEQAFTTKQGEPATNKQALGIYLPKGGSGGERQPLNQGRGALDLSEFKSFTETYLAMRKESGNPEKFNAIHMIGTFIANYDKERCEELIKKCKAVIE